MPLSQAGRAVSVAAFVMASAGLVLLRRRRNKKHVVVVCAVAEEAIHVEQQLRSKK